MLCFVVCFEHFLLQNVCTSKIKLLKTLVGNHSSYSLILQGSVQFNPSNCVYCESSTHIMWKGLELQFHFILFYSNHMRDVFISSECHLHLGIQLTLWLEVCWDLIGILFIHTCKEVVFQHHLLHQHLTFSFISVAAHKGAEAKLQRSWTPSKCFNVKPVVYEVLVSSF